MEHVKVRDFSKKFSHYLRKMKEGETFMVNYAEIGIVEKVITNEMVAEEYIDEMKKNKEVNPLDKCKKFEARAEKPEGIPDAVPSCHKCGQVKIPLKNINGEATCYECGGGKGSGFHGYPDYS